METLMFGDILRSARHQAGPGGSKITQVKAAELATENLVEITGDESASISNNDISRYEREERVPSEDERVEALVYALGIDDETAEKLFNRIRRARSKTDSPAGMVSSEDELNPWKNAALSTRLPNETRVLLANIYDLIDYKNWVAVGTTEELRKVANLGEDEIEPAIEGAINSPFLERVGSPNVEWVFRLTFPGE